MRHISVLIFGLLLSACKIVVTVPESGRVASDSGAYDCDSGETCEIDVVDLFFEETFTALPAEGQLFLGWRKKNRGFCGGKTAACELTSAPLEGIAILEEILWSDERFYLEPVFAPMGGPSFNIRYCEVLIGRLVDGAVEAEVWGTQSINDCPEPNVRALDAAAIAADNDALWALINGPRSQGHEVAPTCARIRPQSPQTSGLGHLCDYEHAL